MRQSFVFLGAPFTIVAALTLGACGDSGSDAGAESGGSNAAGGSKASTGGSSSVSGGTGGSAPGSGGTGGSKGTPTGGSLATGGSAGGSAGAGATLGLRVEGNRILTPEGAPFHGRGANLHDTRSCNACTHLEPNVEGLNRWADELIDWGATFIRFDLEAYADDAGYRQQWLSLTEDAGYLADIVTAVGNMTAEPGVYVMVTLFIDPTIKENNSDYDSEWPTPETIPVYEALADALADDQKVLFGLTNEPHGPEDRNPELAERYLASIDAIHAVEQARGVPEHIVVVQAPQTWSRYLDYFVENPIERTNVAYEVHVYNPQSDYDGLLVQPSQSLPILVGEYGPSAYSTLEDIRALWELCQDLEIPHIAWTFHMRCPPNMLEDTPSDGCGHDPETGFDFPRTTDWGDPFYEYLQTPW